MINSLNRVTRVLMITRLTRFNDEKVLSWNDESLQVWKVAHL
jgi:hypothetical protein